DSAAALGLADLVAVHTGDRTNLPGVAPPRLLERLGDLADGRLRPGCVDGQGEQVPFPFRARRRTGQPAQGVLDGAGVAFGPQPFELLELLGADLGVVDLQHVDLLVGFGPVLVDADDGLTSGVDARLGARRGLLDAHLRDARVDGLGHAARGLDLVDVRPRAAGEVVGELLDERAAAPRVDHARGAGLLLQQQLRVAGDP